MQLIIDFYNLIGNTSIKLIYFYRLFLNYTKSVQILIFWAILRRFESENRTLVFIIKLKLLIVCQEKDVSKLQPIIDFYNLIGNTSFELKPFANSY
jgi:hypothetical protein